MAQPPAGSFNRQGNGQNMNIGHMYGKVVDSSTNKGIDAASVQLIGHKFDSATKKMKDVIVATLITEKNGDFSIENLSMFGNYQLHISAVGYTDYNKPVSFGIKRPQGGAASTDNSQQDRAQQMLGMIDKDLGNIKLAASETNLTGVTVTASAKPFFEMGVDRKIFNVDKNIVSTGQTATELMKQIPTLNVDIDGNVTLRNATPTLFVDGRPTTLTLDQIPADIIDRVELVTNPSAKYDASGGNAGILNIVLKKNKKTGYNGGVRMGVDSRGKINTGVDINVRQNKLNFFLSGNYNQRKSKSTSITDRNNFIDPVSTIHQTSDAVNEGYFAFLRGGLDYFVDNRNTISLAANYNRGQFNSSESQIIDSTINTVFATHSDRYTNSKRNFKNFGGMLSFRHNFTENGHDITADINYNSSTNNNAGNYTTNYLTPPSYSIKYPSLLQQTNGFGSNKFLTIQSDYENQFNDKNKIEAGVRTAIRNFENLNDQYFYDYSTDEYALLPSISSKYKFTDQVYAAYTTYSLKTKKINYQLGLRLESSNYDGNLIGKDSAFSVKYPVSLFPSAFITYKLTEKQDFQVNYSRRINRPNFFQLLPFIDNSDPLNISIGNPDLKPEFTNSFELNYNYAYKKGANFLVSAYYKRTNNLITNFIYRNINPDTTINKNDSVYYTTFVNADNSRSFGMEFTNKITLAKIWDLTVNVNVFNSKINGGDAQSNITNEKWSWFAKINNNFKLPKGFSIQLSGDYQARTVLPANSGGGRGGGGFFGGSITSAQGYLDPRYSFDVAVKKDWTWKNGKSLSLTLSMNDFLRTQVYKTYSESDYFNQYSERRRDPQVLRFNLNYRFGKFDASLFKRKNTKADNSGGNDMIQ
ncbi:TonB-dependent receptor [Panacibacter ginsenosidivorans]|uniref:TonB-dependent receptor n=1 Tax=Panacibacter ginsenosidivorans TaxID=1813871 RepID=A0A5B8VCY7_9BACT|nr:outer membrane beta-barrel family protein [Panacibacter ginsenosidivorans]QEC68853.1 TonB-dependent receptor [Panacibacter ginsenosidivorans]